MFFYAFFVSLLKCFIYICIYMERIRKQQERKLNELKSLFDNSEIN